MRTLLNIFADVFGVGKIDVADLDHDGDMDVLYLTNGDNQIGYLNYDGNQNFNWLLEYEFYNS